MVCQGVAYRPASAALASASSSMRRHVRSICSCSEPLHTKQARANSCRARTAAAARAAQVFHAAVLSTSHQRASAAHARSRCAAHAAALPRHVLKALAALPPHQ